jgi:Flp pilus assembly pilin Flp
LVIGFQLELLDNVIRIYIEGYVAGFSGEEGVGMKRKNSGQALVEYGFLLVLAVLAVIAILNMVSPAIGQTFHNAVDDTVNADTRSIGGRVTQTVYAMTHVPVVPTNTYTFTIAPTNTYTPVPATATFTFTPSKTNTPVPPSSTNTFTPTNSQTPTNTATSTKTNTPTNTATATMTYTASPTATFTLTPSNTPTFTPTPTPSGPWTLCASESGTCSFYVGTTLVRYGASGSYFYKTITNSTACTNAVFGDPIVGTVKQCWYQGTPPANSFVTVTAVRRSSGTSSNKNKVDISIDLNSSTLTSSVVINDSQAGYVNTISCLNTCTYTMTLSSSYSAAGTVTISGTDFGTQTMSASYLSKY